MVSFSIILTALVVSQGVIGANISHWSEAQSHSTPSVDYGALTDGSLGTMPAEMFALRAILAELHVLDKPEEPAQDSE
jgi:hypothetical protein